MSDMQILGGNGRTKAENVAYARLAAAGKTRQQQLDGAERARQGRRAKARERVLATQPGLSGDVLEREVDKDIARQMVRMRAAALTARRRASQRASR